MSQGERRDSSPRGCDSALGDRGCLPPAARGVGTHLQIWEAVLCCGPAARSWRLDDCSPVGCVLQDRSLGLGQEVGGGEEGKDAWRVVGGRHSRKRTPAGRPGLPAEARSLGRRPTATLPVRTPTTSVPSPTCDGRKMTREAQWWTGWCPGSARSREQKEGSRTQNPFHRPRSQAWPADPRKARLDTLANLAVGDRHPSGQAASEGLPRLLASLGGGSAEACLRWLLR